MGRFIFILFLVGAIPWALYTLVEMKRSHGPRERAWVARASFTLWFGSLIGSFIFVSLAMKNVLFALPLVAAAGLGARFGLKKVRARIRLEENDPDPLIRARPLN